MKLVYTLLLLLPLFISAQKKSISKIKIKPAHVTPNKPSNIPLDGFIITGNVTGYADGTQVSFLNDQTGQPEQQATIQSGKFIIKGKMDEPGFKGLIFANAQPLIPVFLDNSNIKISGDKNAIDKLQITGSPSHAQFTEYIAQLKPYEKIFAAGAAYDSTGINAVKKISEDFVKKYPDSYVSPLAVIRLYQASADVKKAEELYNLLAANVKTSYLATYINQTIQEAKINALGSVINDFSQEDTAGKPFSISSLRGKYVLIDFWASWCRPCRMENPNVVAAFNKYKDKNFTVLGVSLDQAKPAWLNAIEMDNLTWNHVSDLRGWGNAIARQFRISTIPQNLLIDPQGHIIGKNLRGEDLDRKLETVLR